MGLVSNNALVYRPLLNYKKKILIKQILFPTKVEVRFVSRRLLHFPVVQSAIGIRILSLFLSFCAPIQKNESMQNGKQHKITTGKMLGSQQKT
jgi:hypothetical protein